MIYCRWFSCFSLLLLCATAGLLFWANGNVGRHERLSAPTQREMVRELQLTDLAIWTEARYTRHPSQADLFTPFQEFPGALEHFPAGSLMAPPPFNLTSQLKIMPKTGIGQ